MAIWRRLFVLDIRAAASRTFWTAERSWAITTARMRITTSSSIKLKPRRRITYSSMLMPGRALEAGRSERRQQREGSESCSARKAPALLLTRQRREATTDKTDNTDQRKNVGR